MQSRWRTLAIGALVPAVVTAGLAVAAEDDSGSRDGSGDRASQRRHHPGPPPGARAMRRLTYGELHIRRRGAEVVLRLDKGKIQSVADDAVTIKRNDGETVSIPVNDDTKVLAGPRRRNLDVDDLKEGQTVITEREGDGAAKTIALKPKRPPRGFRGPGGGPPPGGPPPF
jgi:hypothetical protein